MEAAQLPVRFLETEMICNMTVGETVFITPWAMMVDDDMRCYLNGKYTYRKSSGGTVTMRVERRHDGYHVFVPEGQKYSPSAISWVGATKDDLIPVKGIH